MPAPFTPPVIPTRTVRLVASLVRQGPTGAPIGGAYVLVGPPGTGRRTAALSAIRALGDDVASRVLDTGGEPMSTALARQAVTHMRSRGTRIVTGRLDAAHHNAANILLKSLEERDAAKLWVLTARPGEVLPTIASRCTIVRTPPLTDAEVAAILATKGIKGHEGESLAALSAGSVTAALAARTETHAVGIVTTLLRGLDEGDLRTISTSLRGWGRPEALALRRWAAEFVSGSWQSFEAGVFTANHGARSFATAILGGSWPSRVRVRALAWEVVAAHRARRGLSV